MLLERRYMIKKINLKKINLKKLMLTANTSDNQTDNTSDLGKKADYDTKFDEIEKKVLDLITGRNFC